MIDESRYTNKTLPVLLRNPEVLLIGGGKVALQKAKVLKSNNIDFKVVTISICDELKALGINYKLKRFEADDLNNSNVVVDASGNKEVNSILKELKKEKNFLLNSVDIPGECDFYFSSLLHYKNLKIAISSDGASPALTQVIREKIKSLLPDSLGDLAEKKLEERISGLIDVEATNKEAAALFGKVYIVGCGPGSAELLTVKALNIIRSADIILHDSLVSDEILGFFKNDAQFFCVGKEKGHHLFRQEEINEAMLQYARAGHTVARLKGGDPYIFGRGAEEVEFLINNNIAVEVVPGVSSSTSAPLLAGIPLTHRDYSSGFSVVTAHSKEGEDNLDWIEFLKIKNHTTIVLMGFTQVEKILCEGISKGVDENLPAAVISNASKENQKVIYSTFKDIVESAAKAEKPAVLVFGEVVNLHTRLYNPKYEMTQ